MSLSESSIAIVKSTAPILQEKGQEITDRMYEVLFERYPETKALFSDAPDNQSFKLASAVTAYAANIDKLENLTGAVEKMVAAHVRTGVKAEHYPMVADAILTAFGDVLGDAVTPEIAEAWTEAYNFLADLLIKAEADAYAKG